MMNAMLIGSMFLVIVGLAMFCYICLDLSAEEGWACAIMFILSSIFITGLMHDTRWGLGLVCLVSFLGYIWGLYNLLIKRKKNILSFVTPSIVMVAGVFGVSVFLFRGMLITNWDELYQWGKAANYMVEYDQFAAGANFTGSSLLLSSTTFFHYFIAKLGAEITGHITESNYYVSNMLLWFSALIFPMSGMGWKDWKKIGVYGLFHILLAALIFVQPYYNIYTDQPVAYWAGAVIVWLLLGNCNKKNIWLVPLILIQVGLMKSMVGPLFAVIVILVMLVKYGIEYYENKKNHEHMPKQKSWLSVVLKVVGLIVLLISPFVFTLLWSLKINQNGLFRGTLFLDTVPGQEDRLVRTVKAAIGRLFESVNMQSDHFYISYILFAVIAIAFVMVIYPILLKESEQKMYCLIMKIYIVGFALYFGIMVFAYLHVFEYADSIQAKSLERYFSDYMMLGVAAIVWPLFFGDINRVEKGIIPVINVVRNAIIAGMFVFMVYGSSSYILPRSAHAFALDTENYAERERFVDYAKQIKKLTNEEGKIYFINQSSTGLFTLVADYELDEQITRQDMCFNFREKIDEPIIGLTEYPIDTLPEVLKQQGYSYLWVYTTNNYFNQNMKDLFGCKKVKKGYFYKVNVDGDEVSLEFLKKIKSHK